MAATHYYISVGSNVDEARDCVAGAITRLREMLDDVTSSAIYSTPSVSMGDDSTYCNAVVSARSELSEAELSHRFKELEAQFGRRRDGDRHRVELDLDIVVAGDRVVRPRDFGRRYFRIGYQELTENKN